MGRHVRHLSKAVRITLSNLISHHTVYLENNMLKFLKRTSIFSRPTARHITVGIPKEIKPAECRVGMTPQGVAALVNDGHEVLVQSCAGNGSGLSDELYANVGAKIIPHAQDIWAKADMICKVKEPVNEELSCMREDQLIFGYFHFASGEALTKACIAAKSVCLALETVTTPLGDHPLLTPMSEVAGRIAAHQAATHLEKHREGGGVLIGGVPGVAPAKVLVLGGGVVGTQSALLLAGLGGDVTLMDVSLPRLRELQLSNMPANVKLVYSSSENILSALKESDVVIGGVYLSGAKAPHLVQKNDLKLMKPGSVVIDVCVDQGGCFESTRPTTHDDPTFVEDGVVHYCVANMPGAVPRSSTFALTNATLPYALKLANKGWKTACSEDDGLKNGLNIIGGKVVMPGVSSAWDLPFTNVDDLLKNDCYAGLETDSYCSQMA